MRVLLISSIRIFGVKSAGSAGACGKLRLIINGIYSPEVNDEGDGSERYIDCEFGGSDLTGELL